MSWGAMFTVKAMSRDTSCVEWGYNQSEAGASEPHMLSCFGHGSEEPRCNLQHCRIRTMTGHPRDEGRPVAERLLEREVRIKTWKSKKTFAEKDYVL